MKKIRSKVGLESRKTYCGMDKSQIFKKIILPVLKTLADSFNFNFIDLLHKVVLQMGEAEDPSNNNKDKSESLVEMMDV